jgi:hypothetical protein
VGHQNYGCLVIRGDEQNVYVRGVLMLETNQRQGDTGDVTSAIRTR